jgi:hypothetical protein
VPGGYVPPSCVYLFTFSILAKTMKITYPITSGFPLSRNSSYQPSPLPALHPANPAVCLACLAR